LDPKASLDEEALKKPLPLPGIETQSSNPLTDAILAELPYLINKFFTLLNYSDLILQQKYDHNNS
jgi:hypothetical protein